MTTEAIPYGEQAYIFLEKAKEELQAGDLRQASEKGWGLHRRWSRQWPTIEIGRTLCMAIL